MKPKTQQKNTAQGVNIPDGWEVEWFEKSIVKIDYPPKILKKDFLESGKFPVISQEANFINGYSNKENFLFKSKDPVVIFGDHTKILKWVDFDFILGADGVKILKPQKFLNSKYFYYFLESIDLDDLGYARHYKLLKQIKITYPKSLDEQKQIVKKLDELQEKTRGLEAILRSKIAELEKLKKSVLEKAFRGEL